MSDLELLFLVLVALYLWECAWWMRRGSVGFRTWLGSRWRAVHPSALLGNQQAGFIFAHPLPPLGSLVAANQLPLSLTSESVLAHVASSINPGWRPPQTGRFVRFDEIMRVEPRGKKVLLDGKLLVRTGSPSYASFLAEMLERLRNLPHAKREREIQRTLEETLDTTALERRWREYQAQTRALGVVTTALFSYLFIFIPLLIRRLGFTECWWGLLLGLFAGTFTTAILFRRAHRRLYPQATDERFSHVLMVALYPSTAIRSLDLLSRPLLESFHPLAVAKQFCDEARFREFAQAVLREIRYPAQPHAPSPEPAVQAAEAHARAAMLRAIESFLHHHGLKPAELLQPPKPSDGTCLSYCPRCAAQFTTPSGNCADCGGVSLLSFPHG